MRIAIITFHDTSNFGATLQCTALYRFLSQKGHDAIVINYLPQYVLDKKSVLKEFRKISSSGNKVKALIKGICYLGYSKEIKAKNAKYSTFIANNINLTPRYATIEELNANPPKADLYICGSDQIWNASLTGGKLDRAFFLSFADGRKAAYGASVGEMSITEHAEELRQLTADYLRISAREQSTAAALTDVLKRKVSTVMDCTLLLNQTDYSALETDVDVSGRFLLLYNIQNSSVAVSIARRIAKERNLEIIDISPNPFVRLKGIKRKLDIGPGEFLSLFHKADYVVTNSFHGTVFSIIYEKQFVVIPHSTRSSRMIGLLKTLALTDRIAFEPGYMEKSHVNYEIVNERLAKARNHSISYLSSITEAGYNDIPNSEEADDLFRDQDQNKERSRDQAFPDLVNQRAYCCGCGACANICGRAAITMVRDTEGFPYPHIDQDRCVKCYRCVEVCQFKKDLAF